MKKTKKKSTWIHSFCALPENEFLCEVDKSFIEDDFNLYGLSTTVNYFSECLNTILQIPQQTIYPLEIQNEIGVETKKLYGLVHARYIVTPAGLDKMIQKYQNTDFGVCICVKCNEHPLLPIGLFDVFGKSKVKFYCPCCNDTYNVPRAFPSYILDGAYFGTTFANLLLMQIDEHPKNEFNYVPRIFGFQVAPAHYVRPTEYKDFFGRKSFFHC
ncbi:casein kinase II subunit beta, putative [Entamoeba invadens IP1]|uniref:Casein kinase II subunit beta n=1 Tax=Entamoeba invadens IP1 TaxID=370355 RepID=A0A0A1U798_ENTIV|nr:casein kinase II subunit beta, putative [Entamoeba invadens IP1]ELP88887.1 casein kinase II subunit beta, putative [Entamoeba invadens IP1]|eukprot:XP_004255658.1 casein kinase II subunit beta, putative [Entamoeba invadens IP1]